MFDKSLTKIDPFTPHLSYKTTLHYMWAAVDYGEIRREIGRDMFGQQLAAAQPISLLADFS